LRVMDLTNGAAGRRQDEETKELNVKLLIIKQPIGTGKT